MADYLFTVFFHVNGEGAACKFEEGSNAMKLAMDLERQDYVVKVYKRRVGNHDGEEIVYESDNWVPPAEARDNDTDTT